MLHPAASLHPSVNQGGALQHEVPMQMTQSKFIVSNHGKHHSSETRADSGKNLARLRAEQAWTALHLEHGLPLHTFRLGGEPATRAFRRRTSQSLPPMQHKLKHSTRQSAGIYGPGRNALEAVQQQVCMGNCRTVCGMLRRCLLDEMSSCRCITLKRAGASSACILSMQSVSASQARRGRQRFTARCHVHDICAAMCASMRQPRPGAVYNVVDDEPAPR